MIKSPTHYFAQSANLPPRPKQHIVLTSKSPVRYSSKQRSRIREIGFLNDDYLLLPQKLNQSRTHDTSAYFQISLQMRQKLWNQKNPLKIIEGKVVKSNSTKNF